MSKSKNNLLKKYKERPSPPLSAQDYPNKIKIGNDGNEYMSLPDKNGIYRWKIYNKKKESSIKPKKTYLIHDNGGRPFKVDLYPPEVDISAAYENDYDEDENPIYKYEFFKTVEYEKIFVGKDPSGKKLFDGNSILLELESNDNSYKYMSIGESIYTFKISEEIKSYVSEVGNSDVPYPYALSKNYVYLMVEKVYFPKEWAQGEDYYGVYYGHIRTKPEFPKDQVKELKNVKVIHERII